MPNLEDYIARFMQLTKVVDGHWLWQGAVHKDKTRHGLVSIDGKVKYLHRFIYCLKNNLDYDDRAFLVCHSQECNIPFCWNPGHLYKGDASSNTKDVIELGYHHESNKTHCKNGHKLPETKNKYGKRPCMECRRMWDRERNKTSSRKLMRKLTRARK